jgi:hypothetical protein
VPIPRPDHLSHRGGCSVAERGRCRAAPDHYQLYRQNDAVSSPSYRARVTHPTSSVALRWIGTMGPILGCSGHGEQSAVGKPIAGPAIVDDQADRGDSIADGYFARGGVKIRLNVLKYHRSV